MKTPELLEQFHRLKSNRGLKRSSKRSFVIDYFMKQDRHYSVEGLYEEVKRLNPGISYSTVYRTLNLLVELGLATACDFGSGILKFEPAHRAGHHDHLVCRRCGRIIEFENPEIEKLQNKVAKKYRFLVDSHRMELYGLCEKCQKPRRRNQNGTD
ncbi:MAG TPA: transcriptional repressor [candidate division WOR-3 bacterium]|uniref:Ferric uptake regulation protein n=1 Tax=candidate division WOR-3 bacterium TaxID=2052148 RepID=A0A9C9ENS4_UNCW3|nr:transcriptional repressor [candidate division WOR-3 bacterium]